MARKIGLGCLGGIIVVVIAITALLHWANHSTLGADVVYACDDSMKSWHVTKYYHVNFSPPQVLEKAPPICHPSFNATDIRWACEAAGHKTTGDIQIISGKWSETVDDQLYQAGTCKRIL